MEEYSNEKTIEKLDPIPGGWNHDAKSKFLDHGFLAIAGETPAAVMRTKRIDLDTLMSNLPGVIVWLGKSESRSSDGVFLLNESKSSETHREDKNLVCSDGMLRAVHGGWYHIQATWIMNGGGANNEYRHAILSLSVADSLRSEMQATMDLSVSGNNYCTITAVVYVDDEDSSIKFTISGLSNDALVTSRLDNISVHKLAAVTSAANIHAEGELEQKQSDWNESDPNKVEYIKNKPDLSVYATTDYVDITKDDILAAVGYATRGNWDRSLQIDNSAHTISVDFQGVAIRQKINNDSSTCKYAKICEADINTVTWINEWSTTLQLALQSSGAYNGGKSAGIFELNLENYVQSSSQYVQKHEEDAKWLLFDGDNKSPSIVNLYLYWRDDSSSQHYELWLETENLKYYESIAAQALINFSLRNHLTSSQPIKQERNIWRFNNIGIETVKSELPTGMTLIGSWSPSNASIKPQEDHGVYYVEYGTTTFAEAEAAYLAGKTLVCREIGQTVQQTRMDDLYFLIDYLPTAGTYTGHFVFSNITGYVQTNVALRPSATYEKVQTTMATRQEVMDSLAAEIAPDYNTVVQQHYDEDSFPIPAGTYVTYLDNTSSSVLQYLYKSKVAIERWEEATSGPLTAPEKWDKILVADELGKGVAYVDVLQTPFADVLSLYNQGKLIVGRNGYEFYRMIGCNKSWGSITSFSFQNISGPVIYTWRVTSDGPAETNNWVTPPDIYSNAWIGTSATPYDETRTYNEGDVVSHYTDLYKCNTDISVAEPWTDAHWTRTTIAAELKRVESYNKFVVFDVHFGQGIQYPTFNDVNQAVVSGKVPMLHVVNYNGTSDSPADYFHIVNYSSAPNYHAYSFSNGKEIKKVDSSDAWSSESTYDSALNEYSTNAVQNKVIYAAIGTKADIFADNGSKTESDITDGKFTIASGNSTTKLTLTSVTTLTILANGGVPNFALTIDNSGNANDVTLSVKTSDEATTLYYSTAGGTSVGAGTIVQLTCVGSCWTLAEFTQPTP